MTPRFGRRRAAPAAASNPPSSALPSPAGLGPSELEARQLEFLLQEHGKVKDEMLAAISAQHTTMTYALTAAAAIFAGLLNVWEDYPVRVVILSLGPLLIAFLWFIWLGELTRMARAARYLLDRERDVNAFFDQRLGVGSAGRPRQTLAWESWVRGDNPWGANLHLGLTYALSTCALFGIAVISTVISVVFVATRPYAGWLVLVVAVCAAVVVALALLGVWAIRASPVLQRGM